ncbi:MAG: CHASE2 domain-containing protein [Candidatus Kapabacteria bacterium]|nr:CHASE2 domain-containing protein [Candidatus Kapabacteria bacterium]
MQDFDVTNIVFSSLNDKKTIKTDTNIVLVNIGYLKRDGLAKQVEILNKWKPKVIALDIMFFKHKTKELDSVFANSISKVENLVLASRLNVDTNCKDCEEEDDPDKRFDDVTNPIDIFGKYGYQGFVTLNVEKPWEEVERTFYPEVNIKGKHLISFAVAAARQFDSIKADGFLGRENRSEIVNFRRNTDKYLTLDWDDVFKKQDSLGFLKDKIILMGFLGPDLKTKTLEDIFFTPMNAKYIGRSFPDMYGVVIHANIISMILDGKFYNRNSVIWSHVLSFIIIYLNVLLFSFIRKYDIDLYETVSLLIILVELVLYWVIILAVLNFFRFEINMVGQFYGLCLITTSYEAYHDSIKPISLKVFGRFRKLISRKNVKES